MQTVSHERHLHVTTLSPVLALSYSFTAEWRGGCYSTPGAAGQAETRGKRENVAFLRDSPWDGCHRKGKSLLTSSFAKATDTEGLPMISADIVQLQFWQDPQSDVILIYGECECSVYFRCCKSAGIPADYIGHLSFEGASAGP